MRAVAQGDPAIDGPVWPTVDLGVGVDVEVQGRAVLGRGEGQVAAPAELDPILIVVAEEILPPRRVLDGLAGVDRDPAPRAD
jgi:hypothetical protein